MPKNSSFNILKVHDRVVVRHNVPQVPKNRAFVFLKVHDRVVIRLNLSQVPKNRAFVFLKTLFVPRLCYREILNFYAR